MIDRGSSEARVLYGDKCNCPVRSGCLFNDEMGQHTFHWSTRRLRSHQVDQDVHGVVNFLIPRLKNVCDPRGRILKDLDCSWFVTLTLSTMVDVPCVNVGDGSLLFTFDQSLGREEVVQGIKVSARKPAERSWILWW